MKDLVLTKCFTRDDILAINVMAHAMYEAQYSDSVKPDDKKGREIFLRLVFANCAHALYMLRQSEEYNRKRDEIKEICNKYRDTEELDLPQAFESCCVKEALENPDSDIDEIITRAGRTFNLYLDDLLLSLMKD